MNHELPPFTEKLSDNPQERQQSRASQVQLCLCFPPPYSLLWEKRKWSIRRGRASSGEDGHRLCMWFASDSWPLWQTSLTDRGFPSPHFLHCLAAHCHHSLQHWEIWWAGVDTALGCTELQAWTSTLSPTNSMTPDKITCLPDVLWVFFFLSCKLGITLAFKVALKIKWGYDFFNVSNFTSLSTSFSVTQYFGSGSL